MTWSRIGAAGDVRNPRTAGTASFARGPIPRMAVRQASLTSTSGSSRPTISVGTVLAARGRMRPTPGPRRAELGVPAIAWPATSATSRPADRSGPRPPRPDRPDSSHGESLDQSRSRVDSDPPEQERSVACNPVEFARQ